MKNFQEHVRIYKNDKVSFMNLFYNMNFTRPYKTHTHVHVQLFPLEHV